jgi:hypothetical protein
MSRSDKYYFWSSDRVNLRLLVMSQKQLITSIYQEKEKSFFIESDSNMIESPSQKRKINILININQERISKSI